MNDDVPFRGEKKALKPSLSLTRTFFGRIRPEETDVSRYPRPGDTIQLAGFGGRLRLNDGTEATLKDLVDISLGGVIIFAYPKAHTPGCTKQVCLFRDAYRDLTSQGFAVYGLSRDSMPNNSSFSDLHRLPFRLICDEKATLITALGLNKRSTYRETMRAVVVLNKSGQVLASMAGNPSASLESIAPVVQTLESQSNTPASDRQEQEMIPRIRAAGEAIINGIPVEEPAKMDRHASHRAGSTRHSSLDRAASTSHSSKSGTPTTPDLPKSFTPPVDLYAESHLGRSQMIDRQVCIVCGRGHSPGNQSCNGQVDMIRETVRHLESSGAMTENCQRELANKLALVAGELAVIAARIDAVYGENNQAGN